jgi:hypothetical protein
MAAWAAWIIKKGQGWRGAPVSPKRNQRGWKKFQPRSVFIGLMDLWIFGLDLVLAVFLRRGLAGRP